MGNSMSDRTYHSLRKTRSQDDLLNRGRRRRTPQKQQQQQQLFSRQQNYPGEVEEQSLHEEQPGIFENDNGGTVPGNFEQKTNYGTCSNEQDQGYDYSDNYSQFIPVSKRQSKKRGGSLGTRRIEVKGLEPESTAPQEATIADLEEKIGQKEPIPSQENSEQFDNYEGDAVPEDNTKMEQDQMPLTPRKKPQQTLGQMLPSLSFKKQKGKKKKKSKNTKDQLLHTEQMSFDEPHEGEQSFYVKPNTENLASESPHSEEEEPISKIDQISSTVSDIERKIRDLFGEDAQQLPRDKYDYQIRWCDEMLTQQLIKLDAIVGDASTRKARKQQINRIQKLLTRLDSLRRISSHSDDEE